MWFQHARKLHSGDEVCVRKKVMGRVAHAKVLNAWHSVEKPNTMMFDVLLETGEFLQNLSHLDLV